MTEITQNLPAWTEKLATFDLETTGIDVLTSRIVSSCVAVLDSAGTVIERSDWLANPGIEIPEAATRVHGITTEMALRDGLAAEQVVAEILAKISALLAKNIPLVIYNAPYDLSVLKYEAIRYDLAPLTNPKPILDPLIVDKAMDTYRKGKRTLVITAEHYQVQLDNAHDAGSDAIAAARVALAIANKFADKLSVSATELHDLQVQWAGEQAESFKKWMLQQGRTNLPSAGGWPVR